MVRTYQSGYMSLTVDECTARDPGLTPEQAAAHLVALPERQARKAGLRGETLRSVRRAARAQERKTVGGLSDAERSVLLKSDDAATRVKAMSRAELRDALKAAGFIGAGNLRRPDAESFYVAWTTTGPEALTGVRCDAQGRVHGSVNTAAKGNGPRRRAS